MHCLQTFVVCQFYAEDGCHSVGVNTTSNWGRKCCHLFAPFASPSWSMTSERAVYVNRVLRSWGCVSQWNSSIHPVMVWILSTVAGYAKGAESQDDPTCNPTFTASNGGVRVQLLKEREEREVLQNTRFDGSIWESYLWRLISGTAKKGSDCCVLHGCSRSSDQ